MAANNVELIFTWYFRFNGYFTVPNFTVHKNYKKRPGGGEADLLGVRFPLSHEEPRNYPFFQDENLIFKDKTDFVIVEMKSGKCSINPAWENLGYRNVQYALKWMGCLSYDTEIENAADSIYKTSQWLSEDKKKIIRIITCGKEINPDLAEQKPQLIQVELMRAVGFLHQRFNTGCNQINRANWDKFIQKFAYLCQAEHDVEALTNWVVNRNSLPRAG
jgi:hypothetical protein